MNEEIHAHSDLELMNIHVRTVFTHDTESRLLFVNEPDSSVIPASCLFLGRTRAGNTWRFRSDLPKKLREELDVLCADEPPVNTEFNEPPRHLESYMRLLEKHAPIEKFGNGLAYHFPQDALPPSRPLVAITEKNAETLQGGFENLIGELPAWQPFVALIEGNRAVSVCQRSHHA